MSDPNQPPQQPGFQPGFQPGMNPKAAAKAAKAYAKASRPWFKKKRFIIPAVLVVLIIIAAATSSGGDDKGKQDNPTSASQKTTGDSTPDTPKTDTPDNSSKGKGPITWGNWQVVGQIQVSKDIADDFNVIARVKNTSDSPDRGAFTVTILKGQKILGTADCFTSDVSPGSTAVAQCSSLDSYVPGWTEVTIENTF